MFKSERQITQTYLKIVKPWTRLGLEPPALSALEIARASNTSVARVISEASNQNTSDARLTLVTGGEKKSGYKQVVKRARYQSRAPGGGPVVKSGLKKQALERQIAATALQKQKVTIININPAEVRENKRNAIKQKLATRWQFRDTTEENVENPKNKLIDLIKKQSVYPMANFATIETNLQQTNRLEIGCFVCLPMICENINQSPRYSVGSALVRPEQPKINLALRRLVDRLEETNFPFRFTFIIADAEANETYGDFLKPGQDEYIESLVSRLTKSLTFDSPNVEVCRWTELRKPYIGNYSELLKRAREIFSRSEFLDEIEWSTKRRLKYFEDLGLPNNPRIQNICRTAAIQNRAQYAAEGPIIQQLFDLLVIADPDPTRLGKNQSFFVQDLPIWYPFK